MPTGYNRQSHAQPWSVRIPWCFMDPPSPWKQGMLNQANVRTEEVPGEVILVASFSFLTSVSFFGQPSHFNPLCQFLIFSSIHPWFFFPFHPVPYLFLVTSFFCFVLFSAFSLVLWFSLPGFHSPRRKLVAPSSLTPALSAGQLLSGDTPTLRMWGSLFFCLLLLASWSCLVAAIMTIPV